MTLSALIRKRNTENLATAIPAISATQSKGEAATVERIATVAVANPTEEKTVPMTAEHERVIRAWLALIDERGSSLGFEDPNAIDELLEKARHDAGTRGYFLGRAQTELSSNPLDERINCDQCRNLIG